MTTLELKTQIQQELDKVPESVLQNVLDLLKRIQQQSPEQIRRDINFRRILSEDKELLKRLAEMIDVNTAEFYHNEIIDEAGGAKGVRDQGSLLAALARPYATFDQQELYPTPVEKAAAIFESLIINHSFIDGNKRIAYVLMRLTLMDFYFDVMASDDEKYKMTISASTGQIRFDEIKQWIEAHLVSINP